MRYCSEWVNNSFPLAKVQLFWDICKKKSQIFIHKGYFVNLLCALLREVRDSKITKYAYMLPISGKDDYGT